MWIKAVKKSKLLRRNFTVNTFCENAMLWILSPTSCKPHQAYMGQLNWWTYVINVIKIIHHGYWSWHSCRHKSTVANNTKWEKSQKYRWTSVLFFLLVCLSDVRVSLSKKNKFLLFPSKPHCAEEIQIYVTHIPPRGDGYFHSKESWEFIWIDSFIFLMNYISCSLSCMKFLITQLIC